MKEKKANDGFAFSLRDSFFFFLSPTLKLTTGEQTIAVKTHLYSLFLLLKRLKKKERPAHLRQALLELPQRPVSSSCFSFFSYYVLWGLLLLACFSTSVLK